MYGLNPNVHSSIFIDILTGIPREDGMVPSGGNSSCSPGAAGMTRTGFQGTPGGDSRRRGSEVPKGSGYKFPYTWGNSSRRRFPRAGETHFPRAGERGFPRLGYRIFTVTELGESNFPKSGETHSENISPGPGTFSPITFPRTWGNVSPDLGTCSPRTFPQTWGDVLRVIKNSFGRRCPDPRQPYFQRSLETSRRAGNLRPRRPGP